MKKNAQPNPGKQQQGDDNALMQALMALAQQNPEGLLQLHAAVESNDATKMVSLLSATGLQIAERHFEPLLFARLPTHIRVADKLPIEAGCTVQSLTREQFCIAEKFEYIAGIHADRALRDDFWTNKDYPRALIPAILHCLTQPRTDLVVAPMGEELGKGLFLAADANPIRAGQVVLIYEGLLDLDRKEVLAIELDYIYNYDKAKKENPITQYVKKQNAESGYAIYAGELGGLARFMQSGLDDYELFNTLVGLSDTEKKHIPTANLLPSIADHLGCPVIAFIATRDIEPREQLTYSYGNIYWQLPERKTSQKVFDHYGRVIGEVKNNQIMIFDKNNLKNLPTNKNIGRESAKKTTQYHLPSDPVDRFNHQENFLNYLRLSIQSYSDRHKNNTGIFNFIQRLKIAADNPDADQAYREIQIILSDKESYRAFSDSIVPLKREIINHVNVYNAGIRENNANKNLNFAKK